MTCHWLLSLDSLEATTRISCQKYLQVQRKDWPLSLLLLPASNLPPAHWKLNLEQDLTSLSLSHSLSTQVILFSLFFSLGAVL
jgi:hypothetical protein